jgi:dephospho-CoA kinase
MRHSQESPRKTNSQAKANLTELDSIKHELQHESVKSSPNNLRFARCGQLLVVVGMPGAGKSAVVEHLHSKGWFIVHFGAITMREIEKRGLVVNESNERKVREELRRIHGMEAFAKLSLADIRKGLLKGPTVIDGLYSWSEYKFLRKELSKQFCVIAIFAPKHIRYHRLLHREVRPLSYEEAEARDFAEIENLEKGGPIAMADFTIQNGGSLKELYSEIGKLLRSLSSNVIANKE